MKSYQDVYFGLTRPPLSGFPTSFDPLACNRVMEFFGFPDPENHLTLFLWLQLFFFGVICHLKSWGLWGSDNFVGKTLAACPSSLRHTRAANG